MSYGRLADPDCTLGTDPRSDPRMVKVLVQLGVDGYAAAAPVSVDSPIEERRAYASLLEQGSGAVADSLIEGLPAIEGVTTTTTTIAGVDGNDVTLFISRPSGPGGTLPAVVHLHGGAMAVSSAADAPIVREREYLAATGVVVVGVEFRNSAGKLGPHPFPAGLNDCASGIRWVAANRRDLGLSHLIVTGASGGGTLTLGVSHKAKREGWLREIAGVYAMCPWISGSRSGGSLSWVECDGYFSNRQQLELMASLYDPTNSHAQDSACWAAVATDEELSGMPPHVISANELDPMRDEALDYYRRLLRVGVPAVGRVVAGTCHNGDLMFPGAMPDVYDASMRDISGFAKSLG